jgi:hypothetical protein
VQRERIATRPGTDSKVGRASAIADSPYHVQQIAGNRDPQRHVVRTVTTGWAPTCKCGAGVIPCTVLDPFGGSGTTAQVSRHLGRRTILCELNEDYAEQAKVRACSPLKVSKQRKPKAPPVQLGQMGLFDG